MKSLATIGVVLALAGAAAFAACDDKKAEPVPTAQTAAATPATPPAPHPVVSAGATPPSGSAPQDIGYDAPSTWQSAPNPNTMRKATFKIPKAAGDTEDAELTVASAMGGVEPNVKRWAGQFGNAEPKVEKKKVNGLDVSIVEIKGNFASGGMGGAPVTKEKQMLLGAIVERGNDQTFFKMVGPEKTVTAAKKDFDAFVASFRAK